MEFFNVLPPEEAKALFLANVATRISEEEIPTQEALGWITARDIYAPHPLPTFRRSTMDGYAVKAADTFGATQSLPAYLHVIDEIPMGEATDLQLGPAQAALVHTGGMIPESADAVVQIEHTQLMDDHPEGVYPFEIEVLSPVAVGQNLIQIGEDILENALVLNAGHVIRPQDIGGFLALGITNIHVHKKTRVAIIATGDELIEPGDPLLPGQIRDINSYTIAGFVQKAGGIPVYIGVIRDDYDLLKVAAERSLADCDMLVISAGSSVSFRDKTVEVIDQLGEPGVLLHGVATRPGKPTILGAVDQKPVLGLPGNPVSAIVQFIMFGIPAINRLQGAAENQIMERIWAKISQNIPSETGREDYIPVEIVYGQEGALATPIFGKSNLIYTLVKADGLLKIPLNKGGVVEGELVEIDLF